LLAKNRQPDTRILVKANVLPRGRRRVKTAK
jgi:hypothetical protein